MSRSPRSSSIFNCWTGCVTLSVTLWWLPPSPTGSRTISCAVPCKGSTISCRSHPNRSSPFLPRRVSDLTSCGGRSGEQQELTNPVPRRYTPPPRSDRRFTCCRPDLSRPNFQCGSAENLLLGAFAQRQGAKLHQVLLDLGHARAGPVSAEQSLVCDLFQPWKIPQQRLGWNAADVEIDIAVSSHQEKCGVHPQRSPAMRQQDLQLGKIDGHIVHVHRISVLIARAGEN